MESFDEVLGFRPRPVEMHFALEAGYFTERFPGIHIASIGPRIINPHSTTEHVSLTTADNIWEVVKDIAAKS
jgi:dipeptidase D